MVDEVSVDGVVRVELLLWMVSFFFLVNLQKGDFEDTEDNKKKQYSSRQHYFIYILSFGKRYRGYKEVPTVVQ